MTVSGRILNLLRAWVEATGAGDHTRALAVAREALADPDREAIVGLTEVFQQLERASASPHDPELKRAVEMATQASTCSFCQRRASAVPRLIAGGSATICTDCLRVCMDLLSGKAVAMSIADARTGDCSFCGASAVLCAVGRDGSSICQACVTRIEAAIGTAS